MAERKGEQGQILIFETYNPDSNPVHNLLKFLFLKDPEFVIPADMDELPLLARDVTDMYRIIDKDLGTTHFVFTSGELEALYESRNFINETLV